MIYDESTKKELDAILKAFENYIDGQNYFDIVYSKKIGYVWIVVDEPGAAGAGSSRYSRYSAPPPSIVSRMAVILRRHSASSLSVMVRVSKRYWQSRSPPWWALVLRNSCPAWQKLPIHGRPSPSST